ncbi:MAG: hypothetical protein RQ866_03325, partial [Bacteroidales bacterium]|nr:hypothetical protein [Bacteroidales bacterium]
MRNHHITFTTLLLFFAFTVCPLAAQITSENISSHTQLRYGPDIGVNITNMVSDTLDYESAWLPSLGFGIHYEYKERAGIKASALYGIRGTNVQSPFFKYRVSYMELVIGGFYKPVSFGGLEAGCNFAFMSNANKAVTSSQSASGTSRIPVGGFGNNHHPYTGIFIQLTENSAISFRYGIPVKNIDFSSYRIGFNYYLGNNNYKKKTVAEAIALEEVHQKIITLRNGVLLVRIPTGRNSIEVLDSLGFHKKARSVENEAIAEQQEIMDAFDVFNFCDVYFFYDYNTPKIINKEYTGTLLVNRTELLYHPLDSALPVFIAEFGNYKKGEMIMHHQHDFQY